MTTKVKIIIVKSLEILGLLAVIAFSISISAMKNFDTPTKDIRMCGIENIKRVPNGRIYRSRSLLRKFKKLYPCPSTMSSYGSCKGWAIDHVIPLACGGCDSIENLQWLPNQIKSAAGKLPKDRWERKLYCNFNTKLDFEKL